MQHSQDKENQRLGAEIRRLRTKNMMTQSELANKVGVPLQKLMKYEIGFGLITGVDLLKLMDALGVTPSEMITSTKESNLTELPNL